MAGRGLADAVDLSKIGTLQGIDCKQIARTLQRARRREQEILEAVAGLNFDRIAAALAQDERGLRMAAALKDTEAKISAGAYAGAAHRQAERHLSEAAEVHEAMLAMERLRKLAGR